MARSRRHPAEGEFEDDAMPVQQSGPYRNPGMDDAAMEDMSRMEDEVGGPASNMKELPPKWWNPNSPGGPRPRMAPGTMAGTPMLNVPETAMPGGTSGGLSQRAMNALNYLEKRTGQSIGGTDPQSIMGLVQRVQSDPKMGSDMDMEALDILMQESGAGGEMLKEEQGEPTMADGEAAARDAGEDAAGLPPRMPSDPRQGPTERGINEMLTRGQAYRGKANMRRP